MLGFVFVDAEHVVVPLMVGMIINATRCDHRARRGFEYPLEEVDLVRAEVHDGAAALLWSQHTVVLNHAGKARPASTNRPAQTVLCFDASLAQCTLLLKLCRQHFLFFSALYRQPYTVPRQQSANVSDEVFRGGNVAIIGPDNNIFDLHASSLGAACWKDHADHSAACWIPGVGAQAHSN